MRVIDTHRSVVEREVAQLDLPGLLVLGGLGSVCRDGLRGARLGLHPALHIPLAFAIASHRHGGLVELHAAEQHLARRRIDLELAQRELLERQGRQLALIAHTQVIEHHFAARQQQRRLSRPCGLSARSRTAGGHRHRRRRTAGSPLQLARSRQAATQLRPDHIGDVRRKGLERQLAQLQIQRGGLVADLTVHTQTGQRGAARGLRGQRGLQAHRQRGAGGKRVGQRPGLEVHLIERQCSGRLHGGVVPQHAQAVDRNGVDRQLHGITSGCCRCCQALSWGVARPAITGQLRQIQPAGGIAAHMQRRAVELNGAVGEQPIEWAHIAQGHAQLVPLDQRRAGHVGERKFLEAGLALDLDMRLAIGGHGEVDLELRGRGAADQAHRQRIGQVNGIGRQIQRVHLELDLGLARAGKRQGLRAGVESRAVEHKGQPRLDLHAHMGGDVADERQPEVERLQLVPAVHRLVVEAERAVAHLDVVDGEVHGLAGRLALGHVGQARQDVVDVVVTRREMGQVDLGRIDLNGFDHRRQMPQRGHLGVDVHTAHLQQRRHGGRRFARGAGRSGNRDVAHREFHRPRAEADLAKGHLATQHGAEFLLCLRLEQWRHRQPSHGPQTQHTRCHPTDPPQPLHGLVPFNGPSAPAVRTQCQHTPPLQARYP